MSELIAALCISLAGFAVFAFLLLRFTAMPGFRAWTLVLFVLLSYPVAAGYVAAAGWLSAFLPDSLLERLSGALVFRCVLLSSVAAAPALLWLLLRYSTVVWRNPHRLVWFVGPACVLFLIATFLKMSPIAAHEFDVSWYRTSREWSEQEAADFANSHRWLLSARRQTTLSTPWGPLAQFG